MDKKISGFDPHEVCIPPPTLCSFSQTGEMRSLLYSATNRHHSNASVMFYAFTWADRCQKEGHPLAKFRESRCDERQLIGVTPNQRR